MTHPTTPLSPETNQDRWFMVTGWVTAAHEATHTRCGRRVTRPKAEAVLVPRCRTCQRALESDQRYDAAVAAARARGRTA